MDYAIFSTDQLHAGFNAAMKRFNRLADDGKLEAAHMAYMQAQACRDAIAGRMLAACLDHTEAAT